jgi:hypothetical protein
VDDDAGQSRSLLVKAAAVLGRWLFHYLEPRIYVLLKPQIVPRTNGRPKQRDRRIICWKPLENVAVFFLE